MKKILLSTISSSLFLVSSTFSLSSQANTFFESYIIDNFTPQCTTKSSEGCVTYQPPGACDTWGYINFDKTKVPFGAKVVNKSFYDAIVDLVNSGQLPQTVLEELSYGVEVKTGSPSGMTFASWKLFHHASDISVENHGFTTYNNNPSLQSSYKRVNKLFDNWAALDMPTKILVCHNKYSQYSKYTKSKLFSIDISMTTNSLPSIIFSLNDGVITWVIDPLINPTDLRDIISIKVKRKLFGSSDLVEELAQVPAIDSVFSDLTVEPDTEYEYSFELCDQNNYCEKSNIVL
jgi:hypothetical protein